MARDVMEPNPCYWNRVIESGPILTSFSTLNPALYYQGPNPLSAEIDKNHFTTTTQCHGFSSPAPDNSSLRPPLITGTQTYSNDGRWSHPILTLLPTVFKFKYLADFSILYWYNINTDIIRLKRFETAQFFRMAIGYLTLCHDPKEPSKRQNSFKLNNGWTRGV